MKNIKTFANNEIEKSNFAKYVFIDDILVSSMVSSVGKKL